MIIPIDDKYRIQSTRDCWQVARFKVVKDEEHWTPISHHPNLQQAVNSLYQLQVRTSKAQTLADALADAERTLDALTRALSLSYLVEVKEPPAPPPSEPSTAR